MPALEAPAKKVPGDAHDSRVMNSRRFFKFRIGSDTLCLASVEWLDGISAANHARLLDHTIKARSIV
jgi:hypothetical protein